MDDSAQSDELEPHEDPILNYTFIGDISGTDFSQNNSSIG